MSSRETVFTPVWTYIQGIFLSKLSLNKPGFEFIWIVIDYMIFMKLRAYTKDIICNLDI